MDRREVNLKPASANAGVLFRSIMTALVLVLATSRSAMPEDLPRFGFKLASGGKWLVVSGSNFAGDKEPVWLFKHDDGRHRLVRVLRSPTRGKTSFGDALAIHGDTFVVGASADLVNNAPSAGSVWVHHASSKKESSIRPTRLTATRPEAYGGFGSSIALSDNRLAVGTASDVAANGMASVHVLERRGGQWRRQSILTSPLVKADDISNQMFAATLALDDSHLVVGSPLAVVDGKKQGAVFLFKKGESGSFDVPPDILTAGATQDITTFGLTIAISKELIAVQGVVEPKGAKDHGVVCVFQRDATGSYATTPTAVLAGKRPEPRDAFGESIAMWQDGILVGDPSENGDTGVVHFFRRSPADRTSWELLTSLKGTGVGAHAGRAIATFATMAYVGEPYLWDGTGKGRVSVVVLDKEKLQLRRIGSIELPR